MEVYDSQIQEREETQASISGGHRISSLPVGIVIDHFKVQRLIGHGNTAHLYLAIDEICKREVVLKIYPLLANKVDSDKIEARFRRECQNLANFDHPNIAKLFHASRYEGRPMVIMEYVPGDDLEAYIKEMDLTPGRAVSAAMDIALALGEVHDHGYIHRDVKPSNILITSEGRAKLLDFDIALNLEDVLKESKKEKVVGTPMYMAPEQFSNKILDTRVDQYALALSLYVSLTFQKPVGENIPDLIENRPTEKPSEVNSLIPKSFDIIMKMLSPKPEDRFSNMYEVYAEFSKMLADTPGEPHRPITQEELAERMETAAETRKFLPLSKESLEKGLVL